MEIAVIFCFVGVFISLFNSEKNRRSIEEGKLSFDELADEHNRLTTDYNELVDSYNGLAAEFDEEVDASNKNFQILSNGMLPLLNKLHIELADKLEVIEAQTDDDATH